MEPGLLFALKRGERKGAETQNGSEGKIQGSRTTEQPLGFSRPQTTLSSAPSKPPAFQEYSLSLIMTRPLLWLDYFDKTI